MTDIRSVTTIDTVIASDHMDFGKLPFVDNVDFRLAAEPPRNAAVLAEQPSLEHPHLYIGPTGYNMKPWVGKWYPAGTRDRDFLHYYGLQFNTIEHNTTHYRIPDAMTVERWRDDTPEDFRFCPKLPQSISHARDLGYSTSELRLFCEAIVLLDQKLGSCFLQLPPAFGPQALPVLKRFLENFPPEIPLALEVRHPAFFMQSAGSEAFFQLLHQRGIASVITDVAGRRDVCHMRLTTGSVLIRFVGNGLHPSDYTRVQAWTQRLKSWFDAGLRSAYFFTHEPDNLLAPELAAFCVETFSALMPRVKMRGPAEVPGRQGTLF